MKVPSFAAFVSSSQGASALKRRNVARGTRQEILLRRALWRLGARFRLHAKALPGRPDIVFVSAKVAVFCDGDFWHGNRWPSRRRKLARGSNPYYWIPKILANRARDRRVTKMLRDLGWTVTRLWETDIVRDPEAAASALIRQVCSSKARLRKCSH